MERKTKFEVNFTQFINNDNSEYETILYFPKDNPNTIIMERPGSNTFRKIDSHRAANFMRLTEIKTDWINIPGSLDSVSKFKIQGDIIKSIVPIFEDDYKVYNTTINFSYMLETSSRNDVYDPFPLAGFHDKNFSMTCFKDPNEMRKNRIKISCKLPVFKPYVRCSSQKRSPIITVEDMLMKIGDKFYGFPYGNVHANGHICYGDGKQRFKNMDDFRLHFFSTQFNGHYPFQMNCHRYHFMKYANAEDLRSKTIRYRTTDFNDYKLDMDLIESALDSKYFDMFSLNLPQALYYLSKVDPENVNTKLFIERDISHLEKV